MVRRVTLRALLGVVLTLTTSLTCDEGAGPDPNAVARVVITPDTGSIDTGDSLRLTAVAHNAHGDALSGKTITWSTLDATLVAVSSGGMVHGRWPGQARVVATSEGKSDTATLHVIPKISRVLITPAVDTLTSLFDVVPLSVHAFIDTQPYAGGSYGWDVSNPSVGQLIASGPDSLRTFQALANGATFVRAFEAGGARDSARIVVRQRPKTIYFAQQLRAYRACPLRLTVLVVDSLNFPVTDAIVTWSSSDTTLARIDSSGLVTPLATGSDTIVVQVGSLSRSAELTIAAAPSVTLQTFGVIGPVTTVGRGQYALGRASTGGGSTDAPARFSVVSSDTTILAVPSDTSVLPGWLDIALLRLVGRRNGAVTLTPYLCDVPGSPVAFTVTRPKLRLIGDVLTAARIDDPPAALTVQTRDSTDAWLYPADPVTVLLTGTDATVLRPDSGSRHLAAGTPSALVFFTFPDSGSTRLVVRDSAGLYLSDSTALIHVAYPPIYFADYLSYVSVSDTLRVGMRQRVYPPYQHSQVVLDRLVVGAPLSIQLSTNDSTIVGVSPDSVSIPLGGSGAPIDITGGDVLGTATITARASRHIDGHLVVTTDRPTVQIPIFNTKVYPTDSLPIQLFAMDAATLAPGYATEKVTFTLSASDTSVVSIDSTTLTIPAGTRMSAIAWAHFKGFGTTTFTATDPRVTSYAYAPGTGPFPITVIAPYLATQESTVSLGVRQNREVFVVVNGPYQGGLVVHVRQRHPTTLSLSDTTITIGAYPNHGSVLTTGTASGVDTVVVSAAGFKPDTTIITVGTPTIGIPQWPPSLAVRDSFPLFLQTQAPDGTGRVTADTVALTLAPNSNIEFHLDGAVISTLTIPAGQYISPFFYVKAKGPGTGSVTVTAPSYIPLTKSVTISP